MFKRTSGVLLHITSLPGKYGVGDLGRCAYDFVDFLDESNQSLWQVLPIGATGYGDSPYQSFSAFAGNPYFIDLDMLVEEGLLKEEDLQEVSGLDEKNEVDYDFLYSKKLPLLRKAFEASKESGVCKKEIEIFKEESKYWIEDYVTYMSLKDYFGGKSWEDWPREYKFRDKKAISDIKEKLCKNMEYYVFVQYLFYRDWKRLREYANKKGIKIIGDIPIFVARDSSDAWSSSEIFNFSKHKKPKSLAGCPPDAFSQDGQYWGNPLYNWKNLKKSNYKWWKERVKGSLDLYDVIRIDHFRGFDSFWSIPASSKTARKGKWKKGPGMDLFAELKKTFGDLPIIAEDLGFLTNSVRKLLKRSGFPGMKILQFAFDGRLENEYLPHNYPKNSSAYTGTHDNNTVPGWYKDDINDYERSFVKRYLRKYFEGYSLDENLIDLKVEDGKIDKIKERKDKEEKVVEKEAIIEKEVDEERKKKLEKKEMEKDEEFFKKYEDKIGLLFIEVILSSRSDIGIFQIQDLLEIDSRGRMNTPSTTTGNWSFKLSSKDNYKEYASKLKELSIKYKRNIQ